MNIDLKTNTEATFDRYQAFDTGIQKCHPLNHIPAGLQNVDGVEHSNGGAFVGTYKLFKHLYFNSLKRKCTAINKAINWQSLLLVSQKETSIEMCTDL